MWSNVIKLCDFFRQSQYVPFYQLHSRPLVGIVLVLSILTRTNLPLKKAKKNSPPDVVREATVKVTVAGRHSGV